MKLMTITVETVFTKCYEKTEKFRTISFCSTLFPITLGESIHYVYTNQYCHKIAKGYISLHDKKKPASWGRGNPSVGSCNKRAIIQCALLVSVLTLLEYSYFI